MDLRCGIRSPQMPDCPTDRASQLRRINFKFNNFLTIRLASEKVYAQYRSRRP